MLAAIFRLLKIAFFTPPPAPCCAAGIRWASFR